MASDLRTNRNNKSVIYTLAGTKGIGKAIACYTVSRFLGIQQTFSSRDLNASMKSFLDRSLATLSISTGATYSFEKNRLLQNLYATKSYRAKRLAQKLPVRGQRTRSNARTQKNKRPSAVQQLRTSFTRKSSARKNQKSQSKVLSKHQRVKNLLRSSVRTI